MTRNRHVLIISTVADMATDDVVKRLSARGIPHRRLNTEDYPFQRALTFLPTEQQSNLFSDSNPIPYPSSVWYRRVRIPTCPSDMESEIYDYCVQENRSLLLGSILGLQTRWMNHPSAVWQSEFKPYQLSVAVRLGIPVPRTLMTNDPDAILKAFRQFNGMVAKPVRSGHLIQNGQQFSIFTSRVLEEHLSGLEDARLSPAIYQELVPKKFDVRATVIGRRIFAAAIDSQSDDEATVDWRRTKNPNLPHYPISLPIELEKSLLELMEYLGLTFGAIDLIQKHDGSYVFLEVNPSGQWLWIDEKIESRISDSIAEWLSEDPCLT
jgi:glutathione synthase/RimK-type ligase-like ATP-grasp enzyme